MRLFLILFFTCPILGFSQDSILIRCNSSLQSGAVFIVNGTRVNPEAFFRHLDVNSLSTIDILRQSPEGITRCFGWGPAVIVQLKKSSGGMIQVVKDDNGSAVRNAEVELVGGKSGRFVRFTDSLGRINISMLSGEDIVAVNVRKSGYAEFSDTIQVLPGADFRFPLKPDAKAAAPVHVSLINASPQDSVANAKLYPNPVVSGRTISVLLKEQVREPAILVVYNTSGQQVLRRTVVQTDRGELIPVLIDDTWKRGTYLLLLSTTNKIILKEKFVVE